MCSHPKQASGFTLLELIVAISIAGILMAMAIPSFSDMMRNNRLTTYANELVTALNLARSEAVKRGVPVTVRKISAAGIGTYWSTLGWNVFVDTNGNGTLDTATDPTEIILRTYDKLPNNFSLIGNGNVFRDRVTYQADGTTNNISGTFALCNISDGNGIPPKPYTSKLIIISPVGRIRMGKDSDNDGIPEKDSSLSTELTDCTSP